MLTETKIQRLKPPAKHARLVGDRAGLYLKHYPSGRKTWVHRSRRGGRWSITPLGEYPSIPLNTARSKAAIIAGRAEGTSVRTSALVQEFWDKRIEPRYKRTDNTKVYANRLRDNFGSYTVDTLSARMLTDDLKDYALLAPVAANRCLSFWKLVMAFGVQSGYLSASPLAHTTCTVVGGEEKSRDRILTDDEIQALWLSEHKHAALLRGLLLTGCRISELRASKYDDITSDALAIPENKSNRPHWVHVTPTLREQFGQHSSGRLFESVSPTAVQARLRRAGTGWTPHDLRRTFATIGAAYGEPYVVEKCLNHSMPGVMAIYNRHDYADERIVVTSAVETHILNIVENNG